MVPDCIPANVPINIRLHRAPANYLLLKLSDDIVATKADDTEENIPFSYNEAVIPIMSPVLEAYYSYSTQLESKMNKGKLYSNSINYLDYQTRRQVLDEGLSDYQFNLQVGKFQYKTCKFTRCGQFWALDVWSSGSTNLRKVK